MNTKVTNKDFQIDTESNLSRTKLRKITNLKTWLSNEWRTACFTLMSLLKLRFGQGRIFKLIPYDLIGYHAQSLDLIGSGYNLSSH